MNTTASSARSRSASSNTITGFLPPSSKCRRLSVGAAWAWISDPVADSPTNPIALISGCSVSARPADSPRPCTVFSTPGGRPASRAISDSSAAVQGDHSAGLCTTVQPAASAGAIFHVDSMNGVFHGVITPTGPSGDRLEKFMWCSSGIERPLRRVGCVVGEEPEVLGTADRRRAHEPDGLAGVDAFDRGDLVGPLDDQVGDVVQDPLALLPAAARPIAERGGGGARRGVDVAGAAARHRAKQRAVDRRVIVERVAARARRRLAVDQVQQRALGEAAQLRGSRWRSSPRTCGWLPWKLLRAAAQARSVRDVPVRSAITARRWFSLIRQAGSISWYSTLSIIVVVASPR